MVSKPNKGDTNWDVSLNAALDDLQGQITTNGASIATNSSSITSVSGRVTTLEAVPATTPAKAGIVSWTYDPVFGSAGTALPTGNVHMQRFDLPASATVTNILIGISVAGATLTAGQNFAGLYNSSGTLLAQTADQTSAWGGTGLITMPLTAAQSLTAGTYYTALLTNGTTGPTVLRGLSLSALANVVNLGFTATNARWATSGSGLTSLPGSVTMSSRTIQGTTWWIGLS